MADEPTLPSLPGPSRVWSLSGEGRKRTRTADAPPATFSTSSDPAVFSSDDDPALESYIHGRRKKRYVGTWFHQQSASSDSADSAMGDEMRPPATKMPQRQLRRKLDSGVWMAQGDSTDTDDSMELKLPATSKFPLALPLVRRPSLSQEETNAQSIIQRCVDEGTEEVDLSHLCLHTISNATLEPIGQISPIPMVAKDVAFEQRDPDIKLYMSTNRLRQFPGAILQFKYLTVLSLRGNRLTEIPAAIASLDHLQSLNIAQNSLRSLPSEFLGLLKKGSSLHEFQFHPNPFYLPNEVLYGQRGADEYEDGTFGPEVSSALGVAWSGFTTVLRGRTPVQFTDCTGVVHSKFQFPPWGRFLGSAFRKLEQEDFWKLAMPRDAALQQESPTWLDGNKNRLRMPKGAPSLFELALRAAVRHPEPENIASILADEFLPSHLPLAFEHAAKIHQAGGQLCCVCKRPTLGPVTEWIEFREVRRTNVNTRDGPDGERRELTFFLNKMSGNTEESWVPFVRRGCSWKCVPFKASEPPPDDGKRPRLVLHG